jgi:hypothetical protein
MNKDEYRFLICCVACAMAFKRASESVRVGWTFDASMSCVRASLGKSLCCKFIR